MLRRIASATLLWVAFVFSEGIYCQQAGTAIEVSALPVLIGIMTGVYNFNDLTTSNGKPDIHSLPYDGYLQAPDTSANPQRKTKHKNKATSSGYSQPAQSNFQSSFSEPSGSGGGGDGDGGKPPGDQQRKPADYLPELNQKQDLLNELVEILKSSLVVDNDELIRWFKLHPGFQESFSVQDAHYILRRLQGFQIPENILSVLPKTICERYRANNSRKIMQQPSKKAEKKEEHQTPSQTTSSTDKQPGSYQVRSNTKRVQLKPLPFSWNPGKKVLTRDQQFFTATAQDGNTPEAQYNLPANSAEERAFSGNYDDQFPSLPAPQPIEGVKVPKITKISRLTQQQPAADSTAPASGAAGQQSTDTNRGKAKTPPHKQGYNHQPKTLNAPEEPTVSNENALPAASTSSVTKTRRKKRNKDKHSLPALTVLSEEDQAAILRKNEEQEEKKKIAFAKKQQKIRAKLEKKREKQHQQQPSTSFATPDSQPPAQVDTSEATSSLPPASGEPAVQERSLAQAYQYFMENDSSGYQIWNAISGIVDQSIQNHNHLPEQLEILLWIAARENQLALQALFQLHYIGQLNRPLRLLRTLLYYFASTQELLLNFGNNNASLPWTVATTTSDSQQQYNEAGWEEFRSRLIQIFSQSGTVISNSESPTDGNYLPSLLQWFLDRGFHQISSRQHLPNTLEQLSQGFLQDNSLLPSIQFRLRQRVAFMIFLTQSLTQQEALLTETGEQVPIRELLTEHYRHLMQWIDSLPEHFRRNSQGASIDNIAFLHQTLDNNLLSNWVHALGIFANIPQQEFNELSHTLLKSHEYYEKYFCFKCKDYNPEPFQFTCEKEHLLFMHSNCQTKETSNTNVVRNCPTCTHETRGNLDWVTGREIREGISTFNALEVLSFTTLLQQNHNFGTRIIVHDALTQLLAARTNNSQSLAGLEQWLSLEFFDGGRELLSQLLIQLTQLRTDDNDPKLLVLMQKISNRLSKYSF